jgi:predicted secreted protein
MRLNVVPAASALLAASLFVLPAPALAGDAANFDPIGFSEDGRYFAYEEYGIQDGSGFPYSSIYVVDIAADAWIPGSPFRARLDEDGANTFRARQEARALAAEAIEGLDIHAPAQFIALNGDGEPVDGKVLDFGAVGWDPGQIVGMNRLTLETFEADSPMDCDALMGEEAKGYRLTLESGREAPVVLHEDGERLPNSRGCAMDYRIFGVVTGEALTTLDKAMVIVSVYPFGFEGPDRRFLAVPLGQ